MNRTLAFLISLSVVLLMTLGLALAEEGGNARKGKYLYRKNCRSCHGATASDLSPMSKAQADWKACFASPQAIPCYAQWKDSVSEQDLKDIFVYLHDYAKDSPTPAKCS